MTPAWIEAQPSPPWTLRLYARAPLAPHWIGLLLGLTSLALTGAIVLATDRFYQVELGDRALWEIPGWWSELVNAVLIGLGPTLMIYSLRGTAADVRSLGTRLDVGSGGIEPLVREVTRLNLTGLRITGWVTLVFMLTFSLFDPGLYATRDRAPLDDPFMAAWLTRQALIGYLWARAMATDMQLARRFAHLASRLEQVDLLDLRGVAVFTKHGARSVLFWMLGVSVFSLFWAAPNAGESNWVGFVFFISLAAAGLAIPLAAIHARIRAEKDRVLMRVRERIRAAEAELLSGESGGAPSGATLPALLAYEARIAAVREWPFHLPSVVRIALYVAIGISSWIGAALVERLLGAALS